MKKLVLGISGASGVIYGVRLLEKLHDLAIETHLVMSETARLAFSIEMDVKLDYIYKLASVVHNPKNMAASIASGSFKTMGMIVAPCSIRSLSEIASGCTTSLLTRAADVVLKEKRRLVLLVRETPLHIGHLRAMTHATENGAVIMPPVPAFYHKPQTIDDIINQTIGRCLDMFDIEDEDTKRWQGT